MGDAMIIAIDSSSMRRSGPSATFWVVLAFAQPQKHSRGSVYYQMHQWVTDCDSRSVRFASVNRYGFDGSLIDLQTTEIPAIPVPPDSNLNNVINSVCKGEITPEYRELPPLENAVQVSQFTQKFFNRNVE